MRIALKATKDDPLMLPFLYKLELNRDKVFDQFLKGTNLTQILDDLFKEDEIRLKRNLHKVRRRNKALLTMSKEEYIIYCTRISQWKEYHEFDDARAQFNT